MPSVACLDVYICYAMLIENHHSGEYVRPGLSEIVVILVILSGALLLMRFSGRNTSNTSTRQRTRAHQTDLYDAEKLRASATRNKHMRWFGITLLVIGLIALGYIMISLVDFIIVLSVVAGIIVLAGIAIIILSIRH